MFANPQRATLGKKLGGLEFWDADAKGGEGWNGLSHPNPGKNVLEIFSDDLKNNPALLKQAIYGDLMHGMARDPYWNDLRKKFMANFTPQEIRRQNERKTWWEDVNNENGDDLPSERFGPVYDAYIRGVLADDGNWKQGQEESRGTMYSPKQLRILEQMRSYLKTGKVGR